MRNLIALELKRNRLRPYHLATLICGVTMLGFQYLMAAIPHMDPTEPDAELFSQYPFLVGITWLVCMAIFTILSAVMASRFVVVDMPAITTEGLVKLLKREFPALRDDYAQQFAGLFQDIQKKCDGGELSTKPLDLRGLLAAVHLMQTGLEGNRALDLGLVNKTFDDFERQLVRDVIRTRLPETLRREDVFD